MVKNQEVNWEQYFQHIRPVCPWSGAAYRKGEIKFVKWTGEIEPLGENQAIVYICEKYNRRRLKKLHKKIDIDPIPICSIFYKHHYEMWANKAFFYDDSMLWVKVYNKLVPKIKKNIDFLLQPK